VSDDETKTIVMDTPFFFVLQDHHARTRTAPATGDN